MTATPTPPHADWPLRHCPRAELWLRPRDGHVSVLDACPVAMDWLLAQRQQQGSEAHARSAPATPVPGPAARCD